MMFAIFLLQEKFGSFYNVEFIFFFVVTLYLLTQLNNFHTFRAHVIVSLTLLPLSVVCYFSRHREFNTPLPMAITRTVFLEIAPTLACRLWRKPITSGKSPSLIIKGCPANDIAENSPSFLFKKLRWYFVFKLLTVPVMLQM